MLLITLVTLRTRIYPVGLSTSHVLQRRTFGVKRDVTLVRQCTECTPSESAANISSARANRKYLRYKQCDNSFSSRPHEGMIISPV